MIARCRLWHVIGQADEVKHGIAVRGHLRLVISKSSSGRFSNSAFEASEGLTWIVQHDLSPMRSWPVNAPRNRRRRRIRSNAVATRSAVWAGARRTFGFTPDRDVVARWKAPRSFRSPVTFRRDVNKPPFRSRWPSATAQVATRIYDHNSTATGRDDGHGLGFVIRNEVEQMVGVVAGYTWSGTSELKQFWIDKAYRGRMRIIECFRRGGVQSRCSSDLGSEL